jgi:hypothetical protein
VSVSDQYCDIDFQSMHDIHLKLSGWDD